MYNFGTQAAVYLFVHIVVLLITWWALQSVKWDFFLKNPKSARSKTLIVFLTIAISYLVSTFFLDYLNKSLLLPQIYQ